MKKTRCYPALALLLALLLALSSAALAEPATRPSQGGVAAIRRQSIQAAQAQGRKKKKKKSASQSIPLKRTNDRADYPHLTDAEFANFRNVATTGMGRNVLYRSSSPINPVLGRNREADAAAKAAGIRTVINLANPPKRMRRYEGYSETYYATLNVVALGLKVAFVSPEFKTGLARGLRFLANHSGPYLVHCTEGKDRAGFTCAILECLMGASLKEVYADYMVSFYNYFGVKPGTDQYNAIISANISKDLSAAFNVKQSNLKQADLARCAETFLLEIGLTQEEIAALKARLGQDINEE